MGGRERRCRAAIGWLEAVHAAEAVAGGERPRWARGGAPGGPGGVRGVLRGSKGGVRAPTRTRRPYGVGGPGWSDPGAGCGGLTLFLPGGLTSSSLGGPGAFPNLPTQTLPIPGAAFLRGGPPSPSSPWGLGG